MSAPPHPRSHALPLLCAVLAAASFVTMDSVVKLMASRYGALQLSFFRFAGGSVFAVALWAWRQPRLPSREAWPLHLARSALLLVSLVGYFYALTRLPLVQTVTISYLAPIFVAVLAVPVLGERPSRSIWLALAAGIGGVLISVLPELGGAPTWRRGPHLTGMASAAIAALSFAGVMLLARRQSGTDSICTILLVQSVLPMVLLAGPAAWTWLPLQPGDAARIALVGALGTLGLLGVTFAFTRLEVSRVAPIEYTSFVWAALLGYLLFDEVPTLITAGSAALIVSGCLLLLRR